MLTGLFGQAQQYNFSNYSIDKGLAQSQVLTIQEDSRGYLWLGTFGGGVNIFDGHSFGKLTKKEGLPNNSVWCIMEDSQHDMWICTEGGIVRYDGKEFEIFNDSTEFGSNDVWHCMEDDQGRIWVSTNGDGLKYYEDGKWYEEKRIKQRMVNRTYQDSKGRIWVGTYGDGLVVMDKKQTTLFHTNTGFVNDVVNDIFEDGQGRMWIATDVGIEVVSADLKSHKKIGLAEGLSDYTVNGVYEDSRGDLWIGTFGDGLYLTSMNQTDNLIGPTTRFTEESGLGGNFVTKIIEDEAGAVLIGLDGGGLTIYKGDAFRLYQKEHGLLSSVAMSVAAKNNSIWAGFDGGGVSELGFDGNNAFKVAHYKEESGTEGEIVNNMYTDLEGRVWMGTNSGLSCYANGKFTVLGDDVLDVVSIHCFGEDNMGNLYVGGEGGVFVLKDGLPEKSAYRLISDTTLLDQSLWDIKRAPNGTMYFATSAGMVSFDGNKYRRFDEADGMANGLCSSLEVQVDNDIWIGSENGLMRYDGKGFKRYTMEDGLSSDNIYLLKFDNLGHLFVGSEKGIDRITLADNGTVESIRRFASQDGFTGIECNSTAVSKDKKGMIWVGTIKGLTRINPYVIKDEVAAPKLEFTGLKLFYKSADFGGYSTGTNQWSVMPNELNLPYDKNHLTFEYVGIDLQDAHRIRYRFKMEGFDDEWSDWSETGKVTYSNLPAGNYTFKVKCALDGKGNDHGTERSFSFVVQAPFWQRGWFIALMVVIGLVLIFAYTKYKTAALNKQKEVLENEVKVRTKEIEEQKEELEELSLVASKTDNYVIFLDHDYRITWVNDGFKRIIGFSDEEALGKTLVQLVVGKHTDPETLELIEQHFKDQESFSEELIIYNKEKEPFWASMETSTILNETGKVDKYIILGKDITGRKRAEENLVQKNKDITDSITYAKQIQQAILPDPDQLKTHVSEAFIMYKPRDIVSGDFFWFAKVNDHLIVACADCTGHGVPGALMSMIGNEFLHKVVNQADVTSPSQVLTALDQEIKRALQSNDSGVTANDGMDIALIDINVKTNMLTYSGAFRPIIVHRADGLTTMSPDRYSIGGHDFDKKRFTNQSLQLESGDRVYLFSDGLVDQFGGEKGKKFLTKRFKKMIMDMEDLSMDVQGDKIGREFDSWKGQLEQIDDVCVMGIRI